MRGAGGGGGGVGKATFLLRKNVLSAPAKAHNESGQGCRAAWRERGETKKKLVRHPSTTTSATTATMATAKMFSSY